MILHSTTFPSWLIFNIRNKLIQITQGVFWLPTGTSYLESWVYHVAQSVINVNKGVTEEHGMAGLFLQLVDVSGVDNWGIVEHKVLQDLSLNCSDLYSVICCIFEAWQNRELPKCMSLYFKDIVLYLAGSLYWILMLRKLLLCHGVLNWAETSFLKLNTS